MYGVELYAAVRLAVVDEGLSHHEAGRRFGIDRRTVKKILSYSAPPGYRRTKPVRRPKLDGFTGIVDAILEADTDPDVPRKQPDARRLRSRASAQSASRRPPPWSSARRTMFDAFKAYSLPEQRMPAIMDDAILPDMGRMNARSLWAESHGCSAAPTAEACARRRCTP